MSHDLRNNMQKPYIVPTVHTSNKREIFRTISTHKNYTTTQIPSAPKLSQIVYDKPIKNDVVVLLPYFNYCGSTRVVQNALFVKHMLDNASIPYYIGEVAFNDSSFLFSNASQQSNIIQYRTNSLMFYKENILNLLIQQLPVQFSKVCILDFDIVFQNTKWYDNLSVLLDTVDVCQPFDVSCWLNGSFKIFLTKFSYLSVFSIKTGHSGFAWGMKRNFLEKYPLPDKCLIGSGDTALACLITQRDYTHCPYLKIEPFHPKDTTTAYMKDSCIFHLFHGPHTKRQYTNRHVQFMRVLNHLHLNKMDDVIQTSENGLYEWKEPYRKIINDMMWSYFSSRSEDEIDENT